MGGFLCVWYCLCLDCVIVLAHFELLLFEVFLYMHEIRIHTGVIFCSWFSLKTCTSGMNQDYVACYIVS